LSCRRGRKRSWSAHALDVLLFAAIPAFGLVDGLANPHIQLTTFFLIPLMLITWRLGARAGYLATTLALCFVLVVSVRDEPFRSEPWIFLTDVGGRFLSFFIIVAILAESRTLYLRQQKLAVRDLLTGLYNRLGLHELLGLQMARRRRPFLLLYLDCDNFKLVNDGWGHDVGDQLLKSVSASLSRSLRRSDIACRVGGDEFVVLAAAGTDALTLASLIKDGLDAAMASHAWPVTFSVGVAIFPSPPATVEATLAFADSLMYRVKHAGKNGILVARYAPPRG